MNKVFYSSLILSILLSSMFSGVSAQNNTVNGSLKTPIIEIDKYTGEQLSTPPLSNLTTEQEAILQEKIHQKKKAINESLIHFRSGYSIHTLSGIDPNIEYSSQYHLIRFYGDLASVDKDIRDTLNQLGVTLFDYVPNYAFYAKIPSESFDTLGSLVNTKKIRYIGDIPEEAKIRSELLTKAQTNSSDTFRISVHLFKDVSETQLSALKRVMEVDSYSDTTHFAYGSASGSNIANICRLDFVKWIEEETPARLSQSKPENQEYTESQKYVVVFQEMKPEYKNKVLSVRGVEYVRDTTFGTEEYPSIIISGDQESVEKIKEFNFVIDVRRVSEAKDVMPRAQSSLNEIITEVIMVGVIIILLIFGVIYLERRIFKKMILRNIKYFSIFILIMLIFFNIIVLTSSQNNTVNLVQLKKEEDLDKIASSIKKFRIYKQTPNLFRECYLCP